MEKEYVICDPEELRQLCIRENWFTAGSNNQYTKMFFMNDHPHLFSVKDIAKAIWLCSAVDTDTLYKLWKQGENIDEVCGLSEILHKLEAKMRAVDQAAITAAAAKYPSVYTYTARYASCHHERDLFEESRKLNIACCKRIDEIIREHHGIWSFDEQINAVVLDLLKTYGRERVTFILADTLRYLENDGRITAENKKWAALVTVPTHMQIIYQPEYFVHSHPYVLDGFVTIVRKMFVHTTIV